MRNPFGYFNSSPEMIRLTVMLYIRYPLSLLGGMIRHARISFWLWFCGCTRRLAPAPSNRSISPKTK